KISIANMQINFSSMPIGNVYMGTAGRGHAELSCGKCSYTKKYVV
ncbi:hypothetical protein HMPREF3033_01404, partial [Veillonellaceae bacterium DNF00751]